MKRLLTLLALALIPLTAQAITYPNLTLDWLKVVRHAWKYDTTKTDSQYITRGELAGSAYNDSANAHNARAADSTHAYKFLTITGDMVEASVFPDRGGGWNFTNHTHDNILGPMGTFSAILGGFSNQLDSSEGGDVILGGNGNQIRGGTGVGVGTNNGILGGENNRIGWALNQATWRNAIIGGTGNRIWNASVLTDNAILGGGNDTIRGSGATISGNVILGGGGVTLDNCQNCIAVGASRQLMSENGFHVYGLKAVFHDSVMVCTTAARGTAKLTVKGNVNADTFIGDGSKLTGVNAATFQTHDTTAFVMRNRTAVTWAHKQQGVDIKFTSSAFAVRCTLRTFVPMGGSVDLGAICAASDTFMVYAVHYIMGDSVEATGGTNSAMISDAAGTGATVSGTPSGAAVTLVDAGTLDIPVRGANQISTWVEYGKDILSGGCVVPNIYAGATEAYFNYGGVPNGEGRLTIKGFVEVWARWAGGGAMP